MRADFEKDIEALGLQRRDRGRKLNRFADIVPPIRRVKPAPLDRRAGNCRDEAAAGGSCCGASPSSRSNSCSRIGSMQRLWKA